MVLSTKLKNAISKKKEGLVFSLKNTIINGEKRGCSGFIYNPENGITVYVNTEPASFSLKYMYRYCKNMRDYRGFTNYWAKSLDELTDGIIALLKNSRQYELVLGVNSK
ncbi:MAG: hypothetical protein IJT36_03450 [Alphaproteobacteria bacterium]|nr:hypothetical protein [Alphaproteobacteria bacterium]